MKDILIHTSKVWVDTLHPKKLPGEEFPCICFTLNQLAPYFGEFVYLFDKQVLMNNFIVERFPSSHVECIAKLNLYGVQGSIRFKSDDLKEEFRIYNQPITVERYGIGVLTNYNHMKGVLETRLAEEASKKVVDFSRER